ncbi:MAG: hypothetical protein H6738_22435 [Alphaproteobacteria bacterium]|nr:hypothetical protein [Alphaproteobacteria bacterium]MCB9699559.1 hypothetical protein [Alphaproteobacteria bacterium]
MPACEAWPAAELQQRVDEGRDLLFAEDLAGFQRLADRVETELPCVDGPLDPEVWSTFLFHWSVALNAEGGGWSVPLTTALRTWPEVPRDLGPPALREWAPPPPADTVEPLPTADPYWIDGRSVDAIRDLSGLHVVQRRHEGELQTVVLRDGKLPASWTPPRPPPDPVPAQKSSTSFGSWLVVGPAAGLASRNQAPSEPNDHLPDEAETGVSVGGATLGWIQPAPLALGWDVWGNAVLGQGPGLDAAGLVGVGFGPVAVSAGAGVVTGVVRVDEGRRTVLLPQPELGVRVRPVSFVSLQAVGGASAAAWHARGSAVLSHGPVGAVVGVAAKHAAFVEDGGTIELAHQELGGSLGLVFVLDR